MKRIGFHAGYAAALLVSLAAHRALTAKPARTDREVTTDILRSPPVTADDHRCGSRSGPNVAEP